VSAAARRKPNEGKKSTNSKKPVAHFAKTSIIDIVTDVSTSGKTYLKGEIMSVKAMDLFEAYKKDALPKDQGYVVSSFINGNTGYSIYEVISYSGVKAIYPEGTGLTFQSSGKKMHLLIEPASYPKKPIEPYLREKDDQIPLRFSELNMQVAKNQSKIYMAKKPIESLSSFTVAKPTGLNICFVFYNQNDIYDTMGKFFEQTFNKDAALPQLDAKKTARDAIAVIEKSMSFKGDFA